LPTLPTGHPFSNVQSADYWSASADADLPSLVWLVHFFNGPMLSRFKTGTNYAWCVRGGHHNDGSEY
jgi:hypothetical protein